MESVVFINHSAETFTPANSGALATIIWECCRVACSQGIEPMVITRSSDTEAYPWESTIHLKYPRQPVSRAGVLAWRAERKLTGWRYLRQRDYAARVVKAIRHIGGQRSRFVLLNDPEMAVVLRNEFPNSRIIHWFQNQHTCKPSFRSRFAKSVDVTLGVSDFISNWAIQYYQTRTAVVRTLYNGVDLDLFTPPVGPRPRPVTISFVGRTGIEKAPDLFLNACLLLARQTREFKLQLIGSNHWDRFELDDYQRQLNQLVAELELSGISVRRPGHIGRKALPAEMRLADIHVTPSRWDEPFGLTTLEGMASGSAVVASRTGGTPEIVGEAGSLFDRNSADDLFAKLHPLVIDPELRTERAKMARERAEQFSWAQVWNGLHRVLDH